MGRTQKTKDQLLAEIAELRAQLAKIENTQVPFTDEATDTTESKKVEKELWDSEKGFREFVEDTNDLITRVDSEGRFLYVNDTAERILGLSKKECIGLSAFDFIHPDDRERTEVSFAEWVRTKIPSVTFENRQVSRTGQVHHMLWTINLHFDEQGNLTGINSIANDITEQKQAEQAKAEISDRFQKLAETSFDGIVILDKGKIIEANKAYTKLFGYGISEIIGMNALDFVAPESKDLVLKNISSGYERPYELKAKKKDGTIFPVMACGTKSTYNGGPVRITAIHDITERKLATQSLRESEEKFRLQVTNSPSVLWTTDSTGTTIYISPNVEQVYGFTPEELYNDKDSNRWLERIHPNDAEKFKTFYAKLFSEDTPYDVEYRIRRKDGQWIWLHDRATVHYEKNGLQYAYGVFSDITDRKQAEEALQKSEEKFRSLVTNMPVAVWSSDSDETNYYVSPNVEAIYGYTPEEIYQGGENLWLSRIHPDDLNWVKDTYDRLFSDDVPLDIEYRIRRKDGRWTWVADKAQARSIGNESRFYIGVFSDITERKKSEEALRAAEWLFSFYVDTIDAYVYIKDSQGNYTFINKKTEKLFNIKREDLGKRNYTDFDFFDKETAEQLRVNDRDVMESGQSFQSEEITRPEGQENTELKADAIYYTTIKFPLKDQDGKVTGVCGFSHDITDRKLAEQALRDSEEKFRSLVTNIPSVLWTTDSNGVTVYISPNIEQVYGFTPDQIYKDPQLWLERIHPDDAENVKAYYAKLFSENAQFDVEYRIKRKDGQWIWLYDRAMVHYEKDGLQYASGVFSDITDRKEVEINLQQSRQRLQQLTENIPGMVYKANADWSAEIITGCKSICGYTANEMNAKPEKWLSLVHPDDRDKVLKRPELAARPYSVVQTYRILHKDGNIRWVEDHKASRFTEEGKFTGLDGVLFDITERKQAEQALYMAQYSVEKAAFGVFWITEDAHFAYVNGLACEMLGYSQDELLKMTIPDINPDFDKDKWKDHWEELKKRKKIKVETRHKRKDGSVFPVEVTINHLEYNGVEYHFSYASDITDRKQVEEALQEQERFLTAVFESIQDGLSVLEPDLTVRHTNGVLRNWYRQNLPLEGKKCYEAFHNKTEPCKLCPTLRCVESGKTERQVVPGLEGSPVEWIELFAYPMKDPVSGQVTGVVESARDITERKEAEKLIRYQRDFENLVTEISTRFINLPADRTDHGIDQALKALGEFAGVDRAYVFHSSEELSELTNTHEWCADGIKSYIDDLQHVSFDSVPWWMDELRKLEVIEVPSVEDLPGEASEEKKLFQTQSIRSLIVVPMVYDERLIGFVGLDSVRIEKTWGEKSITLLRIIAEIFVNTIMRHETQRELENYHSKMFRAEQLASLGTISATIAHELNQPLTVLQLLLQQSCRALGRKKPDIDKTIENLNDCLGEISKSITTVDRFRKFAIKSSPIDIRKVDLAKTASAIVSLLKGTAKQVKLTMSLDIEKSPLFIRGNIAEFEQIFFVVIQNAIQAADAKKARKLKINLSSAKGQILLEFADTCGGIDPENVDKIFEPFFTTKSGEVGTGLGLCILERIVKRYDGSLRFENRPRRGITFYIALPMES